ncbi:MAG: hypothetical protein K6E98_05395 [Lachnospiraceae bacterium]|nr:hypothetical protein [Lachnospiraceae bacterium]
MSYNIIIDIDQTLVDSRCAEGYRNQRNWQAAYREIDEGNVKPFIGIQELIRDARLYSHEIVFVSTSPEEYCKRVLTKLGIDLHWFNGLIPYTRNLWNGSKVNFYRSAIELFRNKYQPLVVIGDSENDIKAAYEMGNLQYNLFTIRCLWGLSNERFSQEIQNFNINSLPYLIMKDVEQLRDFLFYRWSMKQDQVGVTYAFDYFPIGSGRYHDVFSEFFAKDIKGYNVSVPDKPVYIEKWSIQFFISYIDTLKGELNIDDSGKIGVMIVPSSNAGRWNSSLEEILKTVSDLTGIRNCAHLMVRHISRESAHNGNDRTVNANVTTMRIENPNCLQDLSALVIFDDITTTGNTYIGCRRVLERDASGVFKGVVKFLALAKTATFTLGSVDDHICAPDKEIIGGANYLFSMLQPRYWVVNRNFKFEPVCHSNWRCVAGGVKWGFPDMNGVQYYLPISFNRCSKCFIWDINDIRPVEKTEEDFIQKPLFSYIEDEILPF